MMTEKLIFEYSRSGRHASAQVPAGEAAPQLPAQLRRAEPRRFGYDLTASGGAGLGNYFTGANASFAVRFGRSCLGRTGRHGLQMRHRRTAERRQVDDL